MQRSIQRKSAIAAALNLANHHPPSGESNIKQDVYKRKKSNNLIYTKFLASKQDTSPRCQAWFSCAAGLVGVAFWLMAFLFTRFAFTTFDVVLLYVLLCVLILCFVNWIFRRNVVLVSVFFFFRSYEAIR